MKYFCRVTKQPKIDLERKTSVHFSGIDTDVTKEEVAEILNVSIEDLIVIDNEYCQLLPGLCGYRMDAESETEVFKELQEFKDSEYIPFDEVITIFSNSKINVNISSSYKDSRVKQIKGRIFEVPMCGGFLLTDYVDGLEDYFKIGEEIVCYETQQDLVEKIIYYLENEKERKTIAMNGYRACQQRHTWKHRFTDIFMALDDMVGKTNLTEDHEYITDNTSGT